MEKKFIKEINNKYPFLKVLNFEGEVIPDATWFDQIPDGWRIAFGKEIVEEISNILKKINYENDYTIVQIKEKFGRLRWYDNGVPTEIYDELQECIAKYEDLSYKTCIVCGKPADGMSRGWICPYCESCAKKNKIKIFPYEG
ncbi:MAG: hypothetical protein GX638_00890 [Crenarchaeota archaeon]|nr:hypothetical protein [Thermoproteota archaeon]